MVKLTTLNNQLYFHVISQDLKDVYISYTKMYNLIINENNAITIKNAIPKNNPKKYKPRNEVIGKIYKSSKTYKLKIAIGSDNKSIESIQDISETFEVDLKNYNSFKQFIKSDFESYEEYEKLKKEIKLKQTNKNTKQVDGF